VAIAVASLCIAGVAGACTPTVPPGPKVAATISLSTSPSMPGLVQLSALASGFRTGQSSPNYDVEWSARDMTNQAVVASSSTAIGNGDGTITVLLQPGLFTPTVEDPTATIHVAFDITMQRGGSTASRLVAATLSWTMPGAPISGSLVADNSYQVQQGFEAVCTPIGTQVRVEVSGATSSTAAGFVDMVVPYGSNFVPIGPSNEVTLTTTTACWSIVVVRASFLGGLNGTTDFTVSWGDLAA